MNPFKVLLIDEDATPEQIKKAYRDLAKRYHPDVCGDSVVFEQIQKAYETLTSPEALEIYKMYGTWDIEMCRGAVDLISGVFILKTIESDNTDPLADTSEDIADAISITQEKIEKQNEVLRKLRAAGDKIYNTKGTESLLGRVLHEEQRSTEGLIVNLEKDISKFKFAIKILSDYKSTFVKADNSNMYPGFDPRFAYTPFTARWVGP